MEAAMKELAEEAGKAIDGIMEEADRELLEAKLKGLTVAELRDYARKNTSLPGLYIAGAKKDALVQAMPHRRACRGSPCTACPPPCPSPYAWERQRQRSRSCRRPGVTP